MNENEMQKYLYEHPEVLFPDSHVQEKASEYFIHGRRIDLLFVVDGVRFIVELKAVPLQRDHIGQVVEYYGLMKKYLQESNLRMVLVATSIPNWRAEYLKEIGIRCVELPEIPNDNIMATRILEKSRASMRSELKQAKLNSLIQPGDRLIWEEATAPATPRTCAIARRFLKDSLEFIRNSFPDYEIVPFGITRGYSPDYDLPYDESSSQARMEFCHGGIWWAYRFGQSSQAPKNDIPNISIMANRDRLEITLNAELHPSQVVLQRRIRSAPEIFNSILYAHGGLWLNMYLKYEHLPRFYHWIPCLWKPPGGFDAGTIIAEYKLRSEQFEEDRDYWINRIIENNKELSAEQISHLRQKTKNLNLATRLAHQLKAADSFWREPYEEQLKHVIGSVVKLRPLVDFFVGDTTR